MRLQTSKHAGSHLVAFVGRLLILITIATTSAAKSVTKSADTVRPQPVELDNTSILQSSSSAANGKSSAGVDTFSLYGGPGSLLGKFQTAAGQMDKQGWTSHDATVTTSNWQNSTFFSPTGTTAMWCGQDPSQRPYWSTPPGYGNGWNELLIYTETPLNPAIGQSVSISFKFNHDLEPGYDFFLVEYDSANVVKNVMARSGTTPAPMNFPADVSGVQPIVYAGNDYGTDGKITIRLRVTSDVAWSDEDGLYPSNGAAQVDDISVTTTSGTTFEDFQGPIPSQHWKVPIGPYFGDFGKTFFRFEDLDPCRENRTPLIGFIDDGTPPSNPSYTGSGTGGSLSHTWNYGIPGGWVVNYESGVGPEWMQLANEWWSPEIEFDLPGSADDSGDIVGVGVRFNVYRHLPLNNWIYFYWEVRGRDSSTGYWSTWDSYGYAYIGPSVDWFRVERGVADLLPTGADRVQVKFIGYRNPSQCCLPTHDATPAPLFDDVNVYKYRIGGPTIVASEQDLFADTFASSGLTDVSTQAARDLLDCRVDIARSISPTNTLIRSGDSLVVRVTSALPGVGISDPTTQIRLHYSLNRNPVFEAAIRPYAPVTGSGGLFNWQQTEGHIGATQAIASNGQPVADYYAFDLPDDGFLYPGDVLEYFIEAVDDGGGTSTLPSDLAGYDDGPTGLPFDARFQVKALPSYSTVDGQQPEILVWNDASDPAALAALHAGLLEIGLFGGTHFDLYTTRAAAALVDNGLGSASPNGRGHGATLAQLAGYSCLIYEAGDRTLGLLSSGSDNSLNDKGNDVGLLQSWFDAPAERYIAHFGDNLAWFLGGNPAQGASASASQLTYLSTVMGVTFAAPDVRASIEQQTAPQILALPAAPYFDADFVAFGGCPTINGFDSIAPAVGAVAGHGFEVLSAPGTTYAIGPGRAASVVWDRMVDVGGTDYRKVSVTFPFGMNYVYGSPSKGQATALGLLLLEVFDLFGSHVGGEVDAAPAATLRLYAPAPNPFNPRVQLRFDTPFASRTQVQIFDLRGRLVRRLLDAELEAGRHELAWDGADDGGRAVASGVYVLRLLANGATQERKLALVR